MAVLEPGKIRNVAVAGHRGTGKTSLVEALLFQSGATARLGSIEQGTTVSDWDEEEQRRKMSLTASLTHADWQGCKINLLDLPGDPGFQGDLCSALPVVETVLVAVSGVLGVEVQTSRVWARAEALGRARVVAVSMLDRDRADFDQVLAQLREQLSPRCVAVTIPIGGEGGLTGIVDVIHRLAYTGGGNGREPVASEVPAELADHVEALRTRLIESAVESDEKLMERYLEGDAIAPAEILAALERSVATGDLFPVVAVVPTLNLGTTALLDLLVECSPSPLEFEPLLAVGSGTAAFVFKTIADPFTGRISCFRVVEGTFSGDTQIYDLRTHSKERIGHLLVMQGKEHIDVTQLAVGDLGAVAKLKDVQTGDLLLDHDEALEVPTLVFPEAVMSFAIDPRVKGEEDKLAAGLRRLHEEDPTLTARRDPQTGELVVSGLSQIHVEVAVERLKRRFGVDVELHPPRVPYLETIRKQARARHRYKKQTGGRGQFGDCEIVIEPMAEREGYEFVDEIVGGVVPQSFRPAVDRGVQEAMLHGDLAGARVQGVRVRLTDGQYHNVDSSEMAFKIAGSMAFRDAYALADPVLLEPIMELEVTVPDDSVGAVNGDLNSRRGRLHGMEPLGGMTTIQADVPMAEILTYAQTLTSLTGGRGEYHMHFLRYEEVPAHIAAKVVEETRKLRDAGARV